MRLNSTVIFIKSIFFISLPPGQNGVFKFKKIAESVSIPCRLKNSKLLLSGVGY
jgi:hypothetical protein